MPVQPWAAYLLNNYEGYDKIFGTLLVVAYVFWKFQEVLNSGRFLRDSYIKFKQNSVSEPSRLILFPLRLYTAFFLITELWAGAIN